MNPQRWQSLLGILRWIGVAIGAFLFVMEIFDALVTPRIDWVWFGLAAALIYLCRPRKRPEIQTRS